MLSNDFLVYGGEFRPRQPVDNKLYSISFSSSDNVRHFDIDDEAEAPDPRVGSASTTVGDEIYLFSGRGGPSMKPLDEAGSLWSLSFSDTPAETQGVDPRSTTATPAWSMVRPSTSISTSPSASRDGSDGDASFNCAWPEPRSYHAMTSESDGTIYLHAGCLTNGRLSDLWAFQLYNRRWIRLADAPSPARGGTSIAFAHKQGEACGKLYRMNGFDGKTEQGGAIDVYDLEMNNWSSIKFEPDGIHGPEPRSVGCLLSMTIGGRESLVTFGGERDPSSLGHERAGKMSGDAWAWDLGSQTWNRVETDGDCPCARGWFAADVVSGSDGKDAMVLHGGLDEQNQRLGDVWLLTF